MDSACGDLLRRPGSPIRASADRSLFAGSPRLFAGSCALRRLLPPRHPPCALVRLAIQPQPAWPGRTRRLRLRFFLYIRFCARTAPPPPGLPGAAAPRSRALPKLLKMPRGPLVPPAGPRRPASAPRALAARRVCRLLLPPDHSGRRNHCGRRPALSAPAPSASPPSRAPGRLRGGGAREDRTPDLLRARQALSQLSYGPAGSVVGLGGIEPPTSPLSGVRSNQLSYRPGRLSLGQTIRCGRSRRGGPGRRKRR